eukprot:1942489-Prymnesium_polylepis.1
MIACLRLGLIACLIACLRLAGRVQLGTLPRGAHAGHANTHTRTAATSEPRCEDFTEPRGGVRLGPRCEDFTGSRRPAEADCPPREYRE